MEIEQTNKILNELANAGFNVLSFGTSFNNPFEYIDNDYFNEVLNRALED